MTFQQLEYLLEVSRTGSISGAAKNLFLAQSSVSASISNLENELGFPIFVRTKKGITPTLQGAHVIEYAARICESYRVMTRSANIAKRNIRIGAPSFDPLNDAFVRLVESYSRDPAVTFTMSTYTTVEAVQKLITCELDIAVLLNHKARLLNVETLLSSKGLQWQNIASIPAVIQIGPGHRLYNQQEIQPKDLQDDLFVDNLHDPLVKNEYLKGIIRLSPDKTVSVQSEHIRNQLVTQGLGYSIDAGTSQNASCFRTIPLPEATYVLSVVTNPLYKPSEATEKYISYVKRALSTLST